MQVQAEGSHRNEERIDVDGLPHVGAVVYPGQGYYSKVDCATGKLEQVLQKCQLHGCLADPSLAWPLEVYRRCGWGSSSFAHHAALTRVMKRQVHWFRQG